jgi:hypothetical protein
MLNVRRCRYCPSSDLSPIRFRPVDWLLLCLAVRRQRCDFCGRMQSTWLLPRPLRWGLAIVLLGAVYVGSTGPVKWLHDNYRMADSTYGRIDRWVYWPLNSWIASGHDRKSKARSSFLAYREWWAPTAESLRTNDEPVTANPTSEDAGPIAQGQTGEPPPQ